MHVILWEFRCRPGCEAEFERVYGPRGEWARLFERGEGYLGTALNRDHGSARRYVVVDRWTTRQAFESFKERFRAEYEALDARCEALTEHEAPVSEAVLGVDPVYRLRVLILFGVALAVFTVVYLLFNQFMDQQIERVRNLAREDTAQAVGEALSFVRVFVLLFGASVVMLGLYLLWLSARVIRSAQWPPPGMRDVRPRRLLVGKGALRIGAAFCLLALLVLQAGVVAPWLLYRRFRNVVQPHLERGGELLEKGGGASGA